MQIQNLFLTAQSTQIRSVISVQIKDFIHHYPMALFKDIHRVGAYFYYIPGSGSTFTTYPGGAQFNDMPYVWARYTTSLPPIRLWAIVTWGNSPKYL